MAFLFADHWGKGGWNHTVWFFSLFYGHVSTTASENEEEISEAALVASAFGDQGLWGIQWWPIDVSARAHTEQALLVPQINLSKR